MKRFLPALPVLFLLAGPAPARTVNIEYILDASGSMHELVGDQQKIDIAKQTLIDLVADLPRGGSEITLNVGLRVYGHSTGRDDEPQMRCRDSVLEIPIEGVDGAGIREKISVIGARGWTPIAYSLLQAKKDFAGTEGEDNIIILISDGKETCGGDPCAVAEELHRSGIALKINVVGFDIRGDEKEELECIARVSGGEYYPAGSAPELARALDKAQEQVLKKQSTSVRLQVAGPGKLRFETAAWVPGAPYRYRIESAADGKEVARGGGTLQDLALPPGKYRLIWRQTEHEVGEVVLADEIEIKAGSTTALRLHTGLHLVPADWLERPPYYWYLKNPATGEEVIRVGNTWDPVLAPPGTYELWYRQWEHGAGETLLEKGLEIKEGEVTEIDLNTGVVLKPADSRARPPYRWVLTDPETKESRLTFSGRWGPVPIPPGRYGLSVRQTEHGHSLVEMIGEFNVERGQLVEIGL